LPRLFPFVHQLGRQADQAEVVQPTRYFERLLLVRRERQPGGHRPAQRTDTARTPGHRRIQQFNGPEAEFERGEEVPTERLVRGGEPLVIPAGLANLVFEVLVESHESFIHRQECGLEHVVLADQLVALHGVGDGDQQFLAQPGFDDETITPCWRPGRAPWKSNFLSVLILARSTTIIPAIWAAEVMGNLILHYNFGML
jgi:hypothetical protein